MTDTELRGVSVQALAYLGDSVIEVRIRHKLVLSGLAESGKLNREALSYVKAGSQAEAMKRILPNLSEEESNVFRRGRNNVHANHPKSATVAEYRNATGMEALMGWLYLKGEYDRIDELLRIGYDNTDE